MCLGVCVCERECVWVFLDVCEEKGLLREERGVEGCVDWANLSLYSLYDI